MKKILLFSILALSVVVLAGCTKRVNQGSDNMSEFEDNSAKMQTETTAEVSLDAGTYQVDVNDSIIDWFGARFVGNSHHGTLKLKSGEVEISDNTISSGRFVIDMNTIEDNDDNVMLEGHLRSEDFFNVETYPEVVFVIKNASLVSVNADGSAIFNVIGDLTIKDVTNEASMQVAVNTVDNKLMAQSEFELDRTRWDIRYGSNKFFDDLKDKAIRDEIELDFNLVANK